MSKIDKSIINPETLETLLFLYNSKAFNRKNAISEVIFFHRRDSHLYPLVRAGYLIETKIDKCPYYYIKKEGLRDIEHRIKVATR